MPAWRRSVNDTSAPAEVIDPLVGRTIAGKFKLETWLGRGSMGTVYRARQMALEKTVAVKILHPELESDATFAARFHREAKAASRLDHPNSIRVLDYGQEPDGLLYMAMEYLPGRDLNAMIQQDWPLSPMRIVDILSQTLGALAVAHEIGILHRDLKSENIMVLSAKSDDGLDVDLVKVCDFGIAKLVDRGGTDADREPVVGGKATLPGLVVGTPAYMSPEQARGEGLDPRSDLYSVGLILYELLTRSLPFNAGTAIEVAMQQIRDEPAPPSSIVPVHSGLEAVCMRAIRKDRSERYPTAREMRMALREALDGTPFLNGSRNVRLQTTREAPLPLGALLSRRLASRRYMLAAATLLAAGAVALWTASRHVRATMHATAPWPPRLAPTSTGPPVPVAAPAFATGTISGSEQQIALAETTIAAPPPSRTSPARSKAPTHSTTELGARGGPASPSEPATVPAVSSAAVRSPMPAVSENGTTVALLGPPVTPAAQPPAIPVVAPGFDLATAHVELRAAVNVAGDTSAAKVGVAIGRISDRLTACYRASLPKLRGSIEGSGMLHVETDETGLITSATLSGPLFASSVAPCLIEAATRCRIDGVDTGSASADVPLVFKAR
jgi:serine/threonine-protein kinase